MSSSNKAINPTVGTTSSGRYLGYTVSWDFHSSFSIKRTDAHAAFENAGFGEFIESDDLNPGTALLSARRAGGGRALRAEVLERPNKDTPAAIGIYCKHQGDEMHGDDFECGARVRIDPHSDLAVALPLEGQTTADPACLELAERIAKDANRIIVHCLVDEMSDALCRVGRACLWANYRDNGGTWFVYEGTRADKFRDLLAALKQLAQKGFNDLGRPNYTFRPRVQPLHIVGHSELDALTEANVVESSEATLENELAKLMKDLEKVQKDGMRASSIEKRIDGCDDLVARATFYKSMLKEAADEIAGRIGAVKVAFEKELSADAKTAKKVDNVFATIDKLVGKPAKRRRRKVRPARTRQTPVTEDELFTV